MKNGKAIINFDRVGDVGEIEIQTKTFKKNYSILNRPGFDQYKMDKTSDDSNVARRS